MPPRITEQSYRPRVSDRTMVATCTCNRFACCASQIDRVCAPPFPRHKPSQNGPRRQGSAAPRRNGAPLTAPGRSEQDLPNMRERRAGKTYDPGAKAHTRYYASRPLHSERGAGCRNFSRLPAHGGAFSLDILFYRTRRRRKLVANKFVSANRIRTYELMVNSDCVNRKADEERKL